MNTILYTIGYEGISIETYFNAIIENNIPILIDVRYNPFSFKKGFNKREIELKCKDLNIIYLHLKDCGIPSQKRKEAIPRKDLLKQYEKTIQQSASDSIERIKSELTKHHRVAITCFESNHTECHRCTLSKIIQAQIPDLQIINLLTTYTEAKYCKTVQEALDFLFD